MRREARVASEDVGRDTSSGSAEEEGGTEAARRKLGLSKGGGVVDATIGVGGEPWERGSGGGEAREK